LIADWQREWHDAPQSRRAVVRLRGAISLAVTVVACSMLVLRTSTPPELTDRIVTRIARFTLIGTALLLVLPAFSLDLGGRWHLLLFQVPSIMTVIFPFAMIGAADEIWTRDDLLPHVARAAAAKIALVSLLAMMFYGGFVVPAANQAWRVATSPNHELPPVAGVRELSTVTLLIDQARVPAYEAFTGNSDRAARIRGELQKRASMALLPLTLLWLRWVSLAAPRRSWLRPLPATPAVCVALTLFLITFFAGWRLELSYLPGSGVGAWLPIVALSLFEGLAIELRKTASARL